MDVIQKVIVHPLVLLSIVDNYNRVAGDTRKRVVGVLLGASVKGTVDVTNSYAVPFEEDEKNPSIWSLDRNYHEAMSGLFKRINAKEHVVGWYSTGPKLRENDLNIQVLFSDYVPNPVLVIIDVQPRELGIPTKAFYAVEEVKENATQKSQKVFVHVPSEIAAHEVEEIGVEHLLRDVKDTTISTLATEVTGKVAALKGLDARLREIHSYLDLVVEGKFPLNRCIVYHLRDIFNLLLSLNVTELMNLNVAELTEVFSVEKNDMKLVTYLSSLIRNVTALLNLINNKASSCPTIQCLDERLGCHSCNEIGHYSEECPNKCFNCGSMWHTTRTCPESPKKPRVLECYRCKGNHATVCCPQNLAGKESILQEQMKEFLD